MTLNEIQNKVAKCIAASLMKPIEAVTLNASILYDLGADSLDLLDIVFALEKEFGIPLKGSELDTLLKVDFLNNLNQGMYLKPEDLEKFLKILPELKNLNIDEVKPRDIFQGLNVGLIAKIINNKLTK